MNCTMLPFWCWFKMINWLCVCWTIVLNFYESQYELQGATLNKSKCQQCYKFNLNNDEMTPVVFIKEFRFNHATTGLFFSFLLHSLILFTLQLNYVSTRIIYSSNMQKRGDTWKVCFCRQRFIACLSKLSFFLKYTHTV